jgi:hypothetical protein
MEAEQSSNWMLTLAIETIFRDSEFPGMVVGKVERRTASQRHASWPDAAAGGERAIPCACPALLFGRELPDGDDGRPCAVAVSQSGCINKHKAYQRAVLPTILIFAFSPAGS